MKLATYFDGSPRIGLVDEDGIWDLRSLYSWYLFEKERTPHSARLAEHIVPDDMALFIRLNHTRLDEFATALALAKSQKRGTGPVSPRPLADTQLLAPVLQPNKIICCGSSYGEYLAELGMEKERWPKDVKISFLKPPSALIGHGETVPSRRTLMKPTMKTNSRS